MTTDERWEAIAIPVSTGDTAGDHNVYLAGAKIVALYPFGPLMGTTADCCLLGYDQGAFVGINADAAAVPDPDTLTECIREGFDAVAALADVGQ